MLRSSYGKDEKNIDLNEIYKLMEIGFSEKEISEECKVSQTYIEKMKRDYYDNF